MGHVGGARDRPAGERERRTRCRGRRKTGRRGWSCRQAYLIEDRSSSLVDSQSRRSSAVMLEGRAPPPRRHPGLCDGMCGSCRRCRRRPPGHARAAKHPRPCHPLGGTLTLLVRRRATRHHEKFSPTRNGASLAAHRKHEGPGLRARTSAAKPIRVDGGLSASQCTSWERQRARSCAEKCRLEGSPRRCRRPSRY